MVPSSFELEKILDYKKNARNKWYFLCRWKGFGPEKDKWEPASISISILVCMSASIDDTKE